MDNNTRFKLYIKALSQFAERTGHTRIPAVHVEIMDGREVNLGAWVGYMRQRYKKNQLSSDKIEALQQLAGWTWGPLKPGPATNVNRNSEIIQMRGNGLTLREIADSYDLSRQRVHQIVKKTNV
jgi:Mor family transcriptional regulator